MFIQSWWKEQKQNSKTSPRLGCLFHSRLVCSRWAPVFSWKRLTGILQSFGGDLMLFIPFLDPQLQLSVRDLSPGKKQGFRTCRVWPVGEWVQWLCRGASFCCCTEHRMFDSSHQFCGAGCWCVMVLQVTIAESVRLLPFLLSWQTMCPVSFSCFLSGSSCSFQSTCLSPVQFPPFPNSYSDVFSSPALVSGLDLARPTNSRWFCDELMCILLCLLWASDQWLFPFFSLSHLQVALGSV